VDLFFYLEKPSLWILLFISCTGISWSCWES